MTLDIAVRIAAFAFVAVGMHVWPWRRRMGAILTAIGFVLTGIVLHWAGWQLGPYDVK